MRSLVPTLFCSLLVSSLTHAQAAPDEPLEEVVVNGEYPGPGMWKVTRSGDPDEHTLWIVGDPATLPKRIQWRSSAVEAAVSASQEIVLDSSVTMAPDEKIGVFRGLSLLPAALKARKNPDERALKDLVPAELYARWQVQKRLYLGRETGVEQWRPIFAADKLRKGAYAELDLRDRGLVWEAVEKLAKRRKIAVTAPTLKFVFKREEIRAKIKEFSRESLPDLECFATTLALTEALSDRHTENARAQAWATGDLATLAALPALPNPALPCAMAVMGSQVAREIIPADIAEQLTGLWTGAVEKSLAANRTTFAIVPLVKLLRDDGYLARLRAKGYLIEAPG